MYLALSQWQEELWKSYCVIGCKILHLWRINQQHNKSRCKWYRKCPGVVCDLLLRGSAGKCCGDSEDGKMTGHWGCWGGPVGVDTGLDTFKNLDQVGWLEPRQGDHFPTEYQNWGQSNWSQGFLSGRVEDEERRWPFFSNSGGKSGTRLSK